MGYGVTIKDYIYSIINGAFALIGAWYLFGWFGVIAYIAWNVGLAYFRAKN